MSMAFIDNIRNERVQSIFIISHELGHILLPNDESMEVSAQCGWAGTVYRLWQYMCAAR